MSKATAMLHPAGTVVAYRGMSPKLADDVYVAAGAVLTGDVQVGAGSSIWFNCVLRGDVGWIRIGQRTNVQDMSTVHVTGDAFNTLIGDDVTIGHRCVIHGCTVESNSLIGMGAVLLDGCLIGEGSLVGAGALVTPGKVFPARSLILGSPAKRIREVTAAEGALGIDGAEHYVALAAEYRAMQESR